MYKKSCIRELMYVRELESGEKKHQMVGNKGYGENHTGMYKNNVKNVVAYTVVEVYVMCI